ncbi:oxepin-CoA hydrolase, alternative type [Variovorax sp. PCZ-1]|uniref:oxepin-CoA hydrolase, alternative type n=1 Tax=Variovorax sp. PCZ-1 TaxID=2835533 RepID=UPI001BCAF9DC|nr:enoyl-CoA hydratase [Variovorax sp. PCZ-1]MBS7807871.1 enoyl-CoA hydratase [Variovorax sp. PCZ-1]
MSQEPNFPSGEIKASVLGEAANIKLLTISNPTLRNALSPAIYAAGIEAINHADSSADVRAVIITGEGESFCAGGNLQRLQYNRTQPRQVQADSIDGLHAWIEAIRTCRKPVIAAVEGAAAGAGFSLSLACDMIIASRDAIFVMAYSTVGLSPDGGGSWQLARALPRQLASELLLSGDRVTAERLHALGVINQLADKGQALGTALQIAEKLAARAPNVLASIKELVSDAPERSLNDHLEAERDFFVNNLHHANGGEGISAFLEKRQPKF